MEVRTLIKILSYNRMNLNQILVSTHDVMLITFYSGFYSHRDTLYGSWYVQEFVHAVESLIFKNGKFQSDTFLKIEVL